MPRSHHQSSTEDEEGNIQGRHSYNNIGRIMTQGLFYTNLRVSISNDLIGPYQRFSPQSESEIYATYAWNVALCESLYPALNGFEIALRRGIHVAAAGRFGSEHWFNGRLKTQEEELLNRSRHRIDPTGVKTVAAADLVGGLSLGFWVNLFKGRYERILWPQLLRKVFPYATKSQSSRELLYQRLNRIRRLRNRVFHHEPIWHWNDLHNQHEIILETFGWISPAMLEMTRLLDRFSSVYTRGAQHYAQKLDSIARGWRA